MAQEWYGDRDESDVVVSLVRSSVAFTRETKTNPLDLDSDAEDGGGERDSVTRKRKRNTDQSEQVGKCTQIGCVVVANILTHA